MTRAQARKKIRSMLPDLRRYLIEETDRISRSGGIDLAEYDDNFAAPKILLSAALHNAAFQYAPFNERDAKTAKNLSNF